MLWRSELSDEPIQSAVTISPLATELRSRHRGRLSPIPVRQSGAASRWTPEGVRHPVRQPPSTIAEIVSGGTLWEVRDKAEDRSRAPRVTPDSVQCLHARNQAIPADRIGQSCGLSVQAESGGAGQDRK